ncbi:MAG: LOG family protein, partial [Methanococcaceae archaeon]
MNKKKTVITVFGSSIPVSGEVQYEEAYRLGTILAENNCDICSGGNLGIMEAVSKGAVDHNANTIGITLNGKFGFHNEFICEHIVCSTLFERIQTMIERADAFIVLQGGTGTLLELAVIWEFMNKGILKKKPIACYGKIWEPVIKLMDEQLALEKRMTGLVKYCV